MAYIRAMRVSVRAGSAFLVACAVLGVNLVATAQQPPPVNPERTGPAAGERVPPFGPASTIDTQHLTVVAGISDGITAPGERHTLTFDVTPKPRIHIYAPGKHTYQVIGVSLDPQPWLRAAPTRYPPSEIYHFVPLNERVEVYMKPFRLERDITVLATPEVRKQLANQKTLTISGRLEYQACDDKLCYAPQSIPVQWTLDLKQLEP